MTIKGAKKISLSDGKITGRYRVLIRQMRKTMNSLPISP
jgi:hypothetical protein